MKSSAFHLAALFAFLLSPALKAELRNGQTALSVLGKPDLSSTSPNGPTPSLIGAVEGVAIDPITNKVFVADAANHRVLRFGVASAYRNGSAAEAVFGQADFTSGSANRGGTPTANTLDTPRSIFVDSTGRLWVADSVNHRILRFDNASSKASGSDADAVLGQADFVSRTGQTSRSGMNSPAGVTVDASGNLFVSDRANHRVLIFLDAASKDDGADADGVIGQPDFDTPDSGTSATDFQNPWGLTVDSAGRLWVCDSTNNRVLRFDDAATIQSGGAAGLVLGQQDFDSSSVRPINATSLDTPYYAAIASNGTLWVGDFGHERFLGFKNAAAKSNGAAAEIVLGQKRFNTQGAGAPSASGVNGANGVAVDREDGLFATDYHYRRVLRYSGSVALKAPGKIRASRGRAVIRGSSEHASLVRSKQPGKPVMVAGGTPKSWQIRINRLSRKITRVRVQATSFDNRSSTRLVRVLSL